MSDRNLFLCVVIVTGVLALFSGCIFDSSTDHDDPEGDPPLEYVTPDTPENAFNNFHVAYVDRDLEGLDAVLAADYVCLFPSDASAEHGESCDGEWTREEDLAAAAAMFDSPDLVGIEIDVADVEAVPSTEIGHPEGAMLIRLSGIRFTVVMDDDLNLMTTFGTVYDLCFRPGLVSAGEDPAAWYLFLWREIAPPNAPTSRALGSPTPVQSTTWWEVRCDLAS